MPTYGNTGGGSQGLHLTTSPLATFQFNPGHNGTLDSVHFRIGSVTGDVRAVIYGPLGANDPDGGPLLADLGVITVAGSQYNAWAANGEELIDGEWYAIGAKSNDAGPVQTLKNPVAGAIMVTRWDMGNESTDETDAWDDPCSTSTFDVAEEVACYITYTEASTPTAALTGTLSDGATEAQIVAGAQTLIITLTDDTWVASGATFDAQRQNIIDGLDSAQSEAAGWNAEVRDKEVVTAVVRTSDTVVTITLSAAAAYAITATETITCTVPATAVTAAGAITATPTFNVVATGTQSPVPLVNAMMLG